MVRGLLFPSVTMIRGTDAMDQPLERPAGLSRRLRLALAGGVALLVLAALAWPAVRRWARADESAELARLRVGVVTRGELVRDIAVQGRVVAANHPRLYSPAQGTVAVSVRPGQVVRRGEVLARLDNPELRAALAQERSRLASLDSELARRRLAGRQQDLGNTQRTAVLRVRAEAAARELERARLLFEQGLLNRVEHDRAKDAVEVARLELAQAEEAGRLERERLDFEVSDGELQLDRQRLALSELERQVAELAIAAPFDGMVATLDVEDRQAVAANQPLLTVVDLSEFEIEVAIPEAYADEAVAGTPALVYYDGRELPGELTAISPEVRSSQVEGTVAFKGAPPPGLRQSQRLSVRLVLDRRRHVLKVPRGPFLESGGGRKVYVLDDDLATLRTIRTGAVSVGEVEVLEGLREGERILLSDVQQFNGAATVLVRR